MSSNNQNNLNKDKAKDASKKSNSNNANNVNTADKAKDFLKDAYEKAKPTIEKIEASTKEIAHYIAENAPAVAQKIKEGFIEGKEKFLAYIHKAPPEVPKKDDQTNDFYKKSHPEKKDDNKP